MTWKGPKRINTKYVDIYWWGWDFWKFRILTPSVNTWLIIEAGPLSLYFNRI